MRAIFGCTCINLLYSFRTPKYKNSTASKFKSSHTVVACKSDNWFVHFLIFHRSEGQYLNKKHFSGISCWGRIPVQGRRKPVKDIYMSMNQERCEHVVKQVKGSNSDEMMTLLLLFSTFLYLHASPQLVYNHYLGDVLKRSSI